MMHSPLGEILIHVPRAPPRRLTFSWFYIQKQKTWSQSCHSFHGLRPSHCPVSRNEQRWKPHVCVYILYVPKGWLFGGAQMHQLPTMAVILYTHEAFSLPCFWLTIEFAKFKTVKTKAQDTPLLYVCVPPASNTHLGLSAKLRRCKDK